MLHGLFSNCGQQGPLSSCHGQASHCSDFSRCRAWALGSWASVAVARGLSCSAARGIKPVSPALAGGFFTPEPPGKPNGVCVCVCINYNLLYQKKTTISAKDTGGFTHSFIHQICMKQQAH